MGFSACPSDYTIDVQDGTYLYKCISPTQAQGCEVATGAIANVFNISAVSNLAQKNILETACNSSKTITPTPSSKVSTSPSDSTTFDVQNSCFCNGIGQNQLKDILCNVEMTAFYFFKTRLNCSTGEGGSSPGSFSGGSGSSPGSASGGSSSGGHTSSSGSKKTKSDCTNSSECADPLVCATYEVKKDAAGKDYNSYIGIKFSDTKLKSGQVAYCSTLSASFKGDKCDYDKECPWTQTSSQLGYCNTTTKKCVKTAINSLACDPATGNTQFYSTCKTFLEDGKPFDLLGAVCDSNTSKCAPAGFSAGGANCLNANECKSGVCKNNICATCSTSKDCDAGKYCDTGACKEKIKSPNECTTNEQCASNVCDSKTKTCLGLAGDSCVNNSNCSGDLVCDGQTKTCKKSGDIACKAEKNVVSFCPTGSYSCFRNNIYVVTGWGNDCKQKKALDDGAECNSSPLCKNVCIYNNQLIASEYIDDKLNNWVFKKTGWEVTTSSLTGKCGLLTAGGYCQEMAQCQSGLVCNSGVCSMPSATTTGLLLLTLCTYNEQCKSNYCSDIGGKTVCATSTTDNLYLYTTQAYANSKGLLVKNTERAYDLNWVRYSNGFYAPNCKANTIASKTGDDLCNYMFGAAFPYCLSNGSCSSKTEAQDKQTKAKATLDALKKVKISYNLSMICSSMVSLGFIGLGDIDGDKEVPVCNSSVTDLSKCTVSIEKTDSFNCGLFSTGQRILKKAGIKFNGWSEYFFENPSGSITSENWGKQFTPGETKSNIIDTGGITCWISGMSQNSINNRTQIRFGISITCKE